MQKQPPSSTALPERQNAEHSGKLDPNILILDGVGLLFFIIPGLVAFGVVPTRPETGYGYIRQGGRDSPARPVAEFVEKPDAAHARAYLASGDYFWNSGMFLLPAKGYLEELGRIDPGMLAACRRAFEMAATDLDFVRLDKTAFESCRSDSIDYAVMEKTSLASVVPLSAGWSDVGSWSALAVALGSGANATSGDVHALDVRNSYIRSESRLVAAVGIENVVVVETPDAVLVAAKDRVEDVKRLVAGLKGDGRREIDGHMLTERPWGWFRTLAIHPGFQVKEIFVRPGAKLSLQRHARRAGQWIVASGGALVTLGQRRLRLEPRGYVDIPAGEIHRLENPGTEPLRVIEVQLGDYLGEDDIERLADDYGRAEEAREARPAAKAGARKG